MIRNILFFTNCQKILSFFIKNPDKEYFDREVSNLTRVSKSGTNAALRTLAKEGLLLREKKGKMYFYKIPVYNTLIKYLKIVQNITDLHPLIEKLKNESLKIILYGSAGKGENVADSDIDLFILTRNRENVKNVIFKSPLRAKIQYIVNTPNELVKMKKNDSVFYEEIEQGVILWQSQT